jgi:hypothetical protein
MDEDQILQSIIADPKLTDPSIDVSKLRQTTPTRAELLADVPEFSGLKFDPTERSYIEDLYALYGGGAPMVPEPVVETPVVTTPIVDTSAMDQPAGDSVLDTTPTTTTPQDFGQSLVDQGIGVQATPTDPVVAPGEMPLTQDDFDDFNKIAVTPVTPVDTSIAIEDFTTPFVTERGITGGPVEYRDQTQITDPVTPIQDLPMVTTSINPATGEVFDAQTGQEIGNLYDEVALTGTGTPEQQEGFLQNVLGRAGQTVDNALNELGKVPGAIVDFANQTVDIFGQKLNVGRTLAAAAANQIVGAPISLLFDLLPERSIAQTTTLNIVDKLKNEKGKSYSRFSQPVGNINVDPFGRSPTNPESYEETLKDDILGRNQSGFETAERRAAKADYARDYFNDKAKAASGVQLDKDKDTVLGPAEIGPVTTLEQQLGQIAKDANVEIGLPPSTVETFRGPTMAEVAGTGKGTVGTTTEIDDFDFGPEIGKAAPTTSKDPIGSFFDAVDKAAGPAPTTQDIPDRGRGDTPGSGQMSDAQAAANRDAARGQTGSGSSGGSPKIVCTMMNESYGFGSFRNKIWLRHSKGLAPEYQKGYHKIFLPLVKLSKKNIVLKKVLEHIAVHRTIDIRQESRGKVHLLGRVYRKILEPICYWVGKHG